MSTHETSTIDAPADPKEKDKTPVYTPEHPEYPKLLYNSKNRTVVTAKDKDEEGKLQGKGYSEDPYPPLAPDEMTPKDMQELESLLHKMLESLAKYSASTGSGSSGAPGTAGTPPPPPPVPGAMPYAGAPGATANPQGGNAKTAHPAAAAPPAKK